MLQPSLCTYSPYFYKFKEITDISTWIQDIDSIETKEDGHLNKVEIDLLKRYLSRTNVNWTDAWKICLNELDENIYTSRKSITP